MKLPSARLLAVFLAAAGLCACGPIVIVDGETSTGSGGAGAGGSGSGPIVTTGATASDGAGGTGGTEATTGSGPNPYADCSLSCTQPAGNPSCHCDMNCGTDSFGKGVLRIACAPTGDGKIQCVCSVGQEYFSGACYEKVSTNSCNFLDGCCSKYFSGK